MENFPVTIHTSTASTATSSPILRETSPPHSIYSRYSTHPTINIALTTIFNMVVTSSRNDRGLNWFSLTDFVSLSSTNKTFHIKSELIWKYLLIHQNHGCLKEKALLDPTIFKIVFLQLNRFKISFENPHFVFKLVRAGSLKEMQSMLNANSNVFYPSELSRDIINFNSTTKDFLVHLREYIDQIKKENAQQRSTSLIHAARAGDAELVQALLSYENCNDPNCSNYIDTPTIFGITALGYAAAKQHIGTVQILLDSKANVNFISDFIVTDSAISAAIKAGQAEIVSLLLDYKADIEIRDYRGMTPLMHAANQGQLEIVHFLIEKNADVTARDVTGRSVGMYAVARSSQLATQYSTLKRARERGEQTDNKQTTLTFIDKARQSDIVNALLRRLAELKEQEKRENHETEENARKRLKT